MATEIKWTLGIVSVGIIACKIFFNAPILENAKEMVGLGILSIIIYQFMPKSCDNH